MRKIIAPLICEKCGLPILTYKPQKGDLQIHQNTQGCFDALRAEIAARDKLIADLIQGRIGPGDPAVYQIITCQVARTIRIIEILEKYLIKIKTDLLKNQERIL